MMHGEEGRLDGWKSIARYLGRDRSTVIRWANERDLPIHSVPGGKSRTVYARKSEIDAWIRSGGSDMDPVDEGVAATTVLPADRPATPSLKMDAVSTTSSPELASQKRWWMVAVLAGAAVIMAPVVYHIGIAGRAEPVARDAALAPAAQAQILEARDDIASRSEQQLKDAIATLRAISRRAPGNVDVHAALAEGYLLAREFGSLPDALALEKARYESNIALQGDPRSATALRVIGVIAYWRDRKPLVAGESFRRAIAAAPEDALAHQWYANILADNGENEAGLREFSRARQLNPGAPHLLADYAWGLWSAGRDREAEVVLADLAARYPDLASIHDCLSVIAFAKGDRVGYERHLTLRASARAAPELLSYADLVRETMVRDEGALYGVMLARGLAQAEATSDSDHSWPAFVASVFGDRAQLLAILRRARARDEHWGAAGYTLRIARRWRTDRDVVRALAGLRQPKIEPLRPVATI